MFIKMELEFMFTCGKLCFYSCWFIAKLSRETSQLARLRKFLDKVFSIRGFDNWELQSGCDSLASFWSKERRLSTKRLHDEINTF